MVFPPLFCSTLKDFSSNSFCRFSVCSPNLFSIPSIPFSLFLNSLYWNVFPISFYFRCFPQVCHWWSSGTVAEKCGLKFNVSVSLFLISDGNTTRLGTGMVGRRADDAAGTLYPQMHNFFISHVNCRNLMATCTAVIVVVKPHTCPCSL